MVLVLLLILLSLMLNFGRLGCHIFLGLPGVLLIWMISLRRLLGAGFLCWMFFDLPPLAGDVLAEVVQKKKSTAGGLMAGVGESLRLFLSLGLMVLLVFFAWLRRPVFGLMACLMPMLL